MKLILLADDEEQSIRAWRRILGLKSTLPEGVIVEEAATSAQAKALLAKYAQFGVKVLLITDGGLETRDAGVGLLVYTGELIAERQFADCQRVMISANAKCVERTRKMGVTAFSKPFEDGDRSTLSRLVQDFLSSP